MNRHNIISNSRERIYHYETKLARIIRERENECFRFYPSKKFYREQIKINAKRFGLILSGAIEPTIGEAKRIANFFNVKVHELIEIE